MKISILCFSLTGYGTGQRLAAAFEKQGDEVLLAGKSKYIPDSIEESHTEWTGKQFQKADAIIFLCACGIAVRSIASFVKNKKTDPAVLVADECGTYVISLLSGHLGGANELAVRAAELLGATAVVTTATDLHHRFAVDVFAKKNGCEIAPLSAAKELTAALLAGEPVGFYSEFPWEGSLPEGLIRCRRDGSAVPGKEAAEEESCAAPVPIAVGVAVSIHSSCRPFPVTVQVIPKIVSLGMGCRRGKDAEAIVAAARRCLKENGISRAAVKNLASIDLKKEEPGLLALADQWQIPFFTYSGDELLRAEGSFSSSEFVKNITGVDNVCQRSAVLASGQGEIITEKYAADGVTAALALREWRVHFE